MRLTEYFWRGPIAAALIGAVVACAGGPSMPVNMAVDSFRERDAEPVSGLGAQALAPLGVPLSSEGRAAARRPEEEPTRAFGGLLARISASARAACPAA